MRRVGMVLAFVVLTAGFAPAPFPRSERRARTGLEIEGLCCD